MTRTVPTDRTLAIAALTQGRDVPSSRFRIRQYASELAAHGCQVVDHCPPFDQHPGLPGPLGRIRRRYLVPLAALQLAGNIVGRLPQVLASRTADLVWISRNVVPGLDELVALAGRPRVLDVDDAIWLTDPRGPGNGARLASRVDAVLAGNEYLAEWYGRHNRNVAVVPTAVDCQLYRPGPRVAAADGDFVVGWMGTSGNHGYLEHIHPALVRLLADRPGARVLVVSDRAPRWWPDRDDRWEFRGWSAEREVADLQDMDAGLMPLADTAWTRGKCSFKMLLSMAAGLPVVVSPVGMNSEILALGGCGLAASTPRQWYAALVSLAEDRAAARAMGREGRRIVEARYHTAVVAQRLARLFREWV